MQFVVGILISVLIGSGSALAWRAYGDRMNPPAQTPQPTSNVENGQKVAEVLATFQAEKDAILKLGTAAPISLSCAKIATAVPGISKWLAFGEEHRSGVNQPL